MLHQYLNKTKDMAVALEHAIGAIDFSYSNRLELYKQHTLAKLYTLIVRTLPSTF